MFLSDVQFPLFAGVPRESADVAEEDGGAVDVLIVGLEPLVPSCNETAIFSFTGKVTNDISSAGRGINNTCRVGTCKTRFL